MSAPLLSVRGVVKNYHALRPLRVQALTIAAAQIVSIVGLDANAAEVLVGLLTGALVADEGEVRLFDRSTNAIGDSQEWLALLEGVGILTDRAVLIEQFSVLQNVALPLTLAVDPIDPAERPAAERLAREAGLVESTWQTRVAEAGADARFRVRLARALALDPRLLIAEHPSATLPRESIERAAGDLARVVRARGAAALVLTADEAFAKALGGERLLHEAATGALEPPRLLKRLFG